MWLQGLTLKPVPINNASPCNITNQSICDYSRFLDDDEMWHRITEKRKEILGRSSLILRSKIPRRMYNVRFDLGSGAPVRAREKEHEEYADENSGEVNVGTGQRLSLTTDQLLQSRTNRLQQSLRQRNERLQEAKRRSNISLKLVDSTDCVVHQSQEASQRARKLREGQMESVQNITSDTKQKKSQMETPQYCEECRKILKERDQFWGLASDSEDERTTDNGQVRQRMFGKISGSEDKMIGRRTWTACPAVRKAGSTISLNVVPFGDHRYQFDLASARSKKAFVIKQKPKGIAGQGTWATPAYIPPWTIVEVDDKRKSLTQQDQEALDKARFGNKRGINS